MKQLTCDRCGRVLWDKHLIRHVQACVRTPLSDDLIIVLEQEPNLSLKAMGRRYGVSTFFLYTRFAGTAWTRERLTKRAKGNRYLSESRNWPQCACGILMKNGEKQCHWCRMEKRGVKNYHDLLGVDAIR